MSNVVAFVNVTLGGVMQAPGRPDEDTRGDFKHGGWGAPASLRLLNSRAIDKGVVVATYEPAEPASK